MAPAKVNLTLEVLGRRADGYHELASVFATVDLSFFSANLLKVAEGGWYPIMSRYLRSEMTVTPFSAALSFISFIFLSYFDRYSFSRPFRFVVPSGVSPRATGVTVGSRRAASARSH